MFDTLVSNQTVSSKRKAALVLELMDIGFEEEEAINSAQRCNSLEEAMSFIESVCELCNENFPPDEVNLMI